MTIRVDSSLIASKLVVGVPGLGVLSSLVPTTGDNGGGILHEWGGMTDPLAEYRVLLTSSPTGVLFVNEDSSFSYIGAASSVDVSFWEDGVQVATDTVTLDTNNAGVTSIITESFSGFSETINVTILASEAITVTITETFGGFSESIGVLFPTSWVDKPKATTIWTDKP